MDQLLTIRLAGQQTAMAGSVQPTENGVRFEPLVPFTRGRSYELWLRNKRQQKFFIPALAVGDKPALLAIYPSPDSLPDNLLKIYLRFSQPMREGQSARYVALLGPENDTLPNVFLDLQPELWNADRTMLTLWLDPGRIKRDLQPNRRLGAPLQIGRKYRLVIATGWANALGESLGKATTKRFRTVGRDSLSPNPTHWTIHPPQPGTTQPLNVAFGESLDYYLLTETMHVRREDGTPVLGTWQVGKNERRSQFTPRTGWSPGHYRLRIESRQEDLAGNNLNRPFEQAVTKAKSPTNGQAFQELVFEVHKP